MYKVVSENFSIFLNSITNYSSFLNNMEEYSDYLISKITKGYFIRNELRKNLINYPKYPSEFIPINNINQFNINKIYNVTQNQRAEGLRTFVPEFLNNLKVKLDKLPESREDFYSEFCFQKLYYEKVPDDVFDKRNFLALIYNVSRENYFFKMFKSDIIENISNLEFFQQVINSLFLSKQVQRSSDFFEQFSYYYYVSNFITYDRIMNSFNNFFDKDDVLDDFVDKLGELFTKSIYSFIEHTDLIKGYIGNVIINSINDLIQKFGQFIDTRTNVVEKNIIFYFQYLLNNYLVRQILDDLGQNREEVFVDPYNHFGGWGAINIRNVNNEEEFIRNFLIRVTPNNIKEYFYLWFSYNSFPLKFINSLPFIVEKMTDDFVFTHLDMAYLNKEYVKGYLNGYEENINFNQYSQIINNNIDVESIKEIVNNKNIVETSIFLSLMGELDNFFDSEIFNDYIYNLMYDIFKKLKNEGFVDYSFDWYQENLSMYVFFKSYLKNSFTKNKLFDDLVYDLKEFFNDFMNKNFPFQEGELLSNKASTKTQFLTKFQFDENSITLYLDNEEVSSNKYNLYGSQRTIHFDVVPLGSELRADYQIYYPTKYGVTSEELTDYFKRLLEVDTNAELIRDLMNNTYYTTIMKQLHLNILNEYLIK